MRREDDRTRPNLFVIGAAKAGTTSLHHHLASHPDVFMSDPKEPGYFTPKVGYYPTSLEWYLGLFENAGDARIVGESSTHYTKLPLYEGVPERIAEFSPNARFIYLMRDPIDRTISHYWHEVRRLNEHRPIEKAIRDDVRYTAISDYRRQLEPYFDVFGRERVLLLTFEELVSDSEAVLDRVYRWLGLDPTLAEDDLGKKNVRPPKIEMLRGFGLLDRFARSGLWETIHRWVPRFVKDLGNRLSRKPVQPEQVDVTKVQEALRPRFRAQVEDLRSFLERDFERWTTTLPQ